MLWYAYLDKDFFFVENLLDEIKKLVKVLCRYGIIHVGIGLHEEITQKESMYFLDVLF